MSLYYYEPFYNFDRFFENFGRSSGLGSQGQGQLQDTENNAPVVVRPRMDLHEDSNTNTVTATFELPGLKKEDIKIDVHDGRLIVSGETKSSVDKEEAGYAVRERRYGKFSRALRLPQGVKETDIKASLENGVLGVTFPKAAAETAPKRINIA